MDSIDWEQCIVCQQMTDDVPHCPANSKRSDVGIGYDNKDEVRVLKLADLAKMYSARLNQLGVDVSGRLHTTELKNRILAQFPVMQAHREGRDVSLAFKDGIAFRGFRTIQYYKFQNSAILNVRAILS